jgi:transposase
MADQLPLTDAQWRLLRVRIEALAEGHDRAAWKMRNPEAMAGLFLLLMDRIDQLEKQIRALSIGHRTG